MIKFYFHTTPNPMKVALFLEETGMPYELVPVDPLKGEQHSAAYLAINPNGKVPAIEDNGVRVFDSNAILLYLSEKSGQLGSRPELRGELLSWMMFVATGLGPFSGQAVHFRHAAPEQIPYAINRYLREAQRHYEVLNTHLNNRDYIVGEDYSTADIAAWCWVSRVSRVLGEDALSEYPNIQRWFEHIAHRPAVTRAQKIGQNVDFKQELDDTALRAMYPQNYASPQANNNIIE
ncbi:MAG: glutathione S-transferase family protein [Oceanisphaera sp.]|uniref:glutathione S-transferase family protein n=1 Tax=Oceanisphaera sp. TaxID=1929979 RepID=UPI003C71BAAA